MVKSWRYIVGLVGLVGLLALLLMGSAGWILHSPAGTRWALHRLVGWSGPDLSIGGIEGTLGGTLQLQEIVLQKEDFQLRLRTLALTSRWHGWFPLRLTISGLRAEQLKINHSPRPREGSPTALRWPHLPRLLGLLRIHLVDAELNHFSWQQENQPPQVVERLRAELLWENGRLEGRQLALQTAELEVSGFFSCGLLRPLLKFTGQIDRRDSEPPWRQLQLQADLQPGTTGQLLQGSVELNLTGTQGERLTATAELDLAPEQVNFRRLLLRRSDRPGQLTASGNLRFSGAAAELSGSLELTQFDLEVETGQPVRLSGSLQFRGGLESYRGRFALENRGSDLTNARLTGDFSGDRQQLTLTALRGVWLAGLLHGQLRADWEQGWRLQAQLTGTGLDPQLLNPRLSGRLNLQLQTDFQAPGPGLRAGSLHLQLQDSTLQGQPLSGEALLRVQNDSLQVEQLQMRGAGLLLEASGNPAERLAVRWRIDRLEQLLAEAAGRFSGSGWLRWRRQRLATEFTATGEQLAFRGWRLAKLQAQGSAEQGDSAWQLQLKGEQLRDPLSGQTLDRLKLGLRGTLGKHQLTLNLAQRDNSLSATFQGGWNDPRWRGQLTDFLLDGPDPGRWRLDHPTSLQIAATRIKVEPLLLHNDTGSEIELSATYSPEPQQTSAQLRWQDVDLAVLRPWLAGWRISGQSSGACALHQGAQHAFHAQLSLAGELERQQLRLQLADSALAIDWDEQGLRSTLQLHLADGGQLHGSLTSLGSAPLRRPRQAELRLTGSDFPLALLRPWLPPELNLTGQLGWKLSGSWQDGEPLNLRGTAHAAAGRFSWQEEEGILGADLESFDLRWQWQQRLEGKLELRLRDQGVIASDFNLPLPASLPLALQPTAPVAVDLQARFQELGLLSLLFSGRIQESRGQLTLDLQLAGTPRQPLLQGNFHLFDAAAFIPALGVQLEEIELRGELAEQRVTLAQLRVKSGAGRLHGSGRLELQNWLPDTYRLQLRGENFQLLNLPDLQVHSNPDLRVEGSRERIKVRGQVKFPDVLISGQQQSSLARNSPDLQVVDREKQPLRRLRLKHDIDLQLLLGERVLLDTAGIDARLEGELRLRSTSQQELAALGEIHVAKGRYSSYGVSLNISRGYLYFTGGPLDQPALDILALRRAGEVKAGVRVTGTPQAPIVQLTSEPAMADTDILSYIVLGRPIGADGSQSGLLLTAAGALLSQGESVTLQEKLKSRLGLDVFDISAGNGDVGSSIITTGKYLSPELYVSLGYSLFSNTNELKIRYTITPDWELESSIGIESGVDMFYRIELE